MISAIIPVYNTDIELLQRCLESVFAQTYNNFEVLLVLNGSSDNYRREVSDKFRHEKIQIFVLEQSGVSRARNYGIEKAKGEYIVFIDADDTIKKDFFRQAIMVIEKQAADLVIGGLTFVYEREKVINVPKLNKVKIYEDTKVELLKHLLLLGKNSAEELNDVLLSSPCAKMYRSDIVKHIKFHESIYKCEDLLFVYDVITNSKRIGLCPDVWYSYYQYQNSAIHSEKPELIENNLILIDEIQKLNAACSELFAEEFGYFCVEMFRDMFVRLIRSGYHYKDIRVYKKLINQYRKHFWCEGRKCSKYLRWHQKIVYYMIKSGLLQMWYCYEWVGVRIKRRIYKLKKGLIG